MKKTNIQKGKFVEIVNNIVAEINNTGFFVNDIDKFGIGNLKPIK